MTGVQKVREHLDPAVIVFDVASWVFQAGRVLRYTLQHH